MWRYLWQHFLVDSRIKQFIAQKIADIYTQYDCTTILEIGPGKWAITHLIKHIPRYFFAIDKDPTFYEHWQLDIDHWSFILSDILEVDVQQLLSDKHISLSQTLIIGNLPYYITSPILRKFFWYGKQDYAGGFFMIQDEVGQKIQTDAKKKSYLWRLLNYAYDVRYIKTVPARCFNPPPKVKSCLIEISRKNSISSISFDRLVAFLDVFSPFSRKTLGAIQTMIDKRLARTDVSHSTLVTYTIPEIFKKKRLEELSWNDIEQILW